MKGTKGILILILLSNFSFAQICKFNHHSVFVLDVIDSSSQQKIHNLSIALSDEYGRPFQEYYNDGDGDKTTNFPKVDSFFFWENLSISTPIINKYVISFNRQKFKGIGDYYVCVVPTYSGCFDQVNAMRNWHRTNAWQVAVKELFVYAKISGPNMATQLVKIPSNAFYDICTNNLLDPLSKCNIEPIRIRITIASGKATVKDNRFDVIQYQLTESFGGHGGALSQIELIDEETEVLVQKFPDFDLFFGDKKSTPNIHFWSHKGMKVIDFGKGNSQSSRLLLPAEFVSDTAKNNFEHYESFIVYRFDSLIKRYVVDSLLSAPDYLNVYRFGANSSNPKGINIMGLNMSKEGKSFVCEHIKLVDGKWQPSWKEKREPSQENKMKSKYNDVVQNVQINPTQFYIQWKDIGKSLPTELFTIPRLLSQFPKLLITPSNEQTNISIIDISNFNGFERMEFFKYLENNDSVNFVAQIFKEDSAIKYFDGKVHVPIDKKLLSKSQMIDANALGFIIREWDYHNGRRVSSSFSYSSKIIDYNFLKSYEYLCNAFGALKLELNVHEIMNSKIKE